MKTFYFITLIFSGILLASCCNKTEVNPDGETQPIDRFMPNFTISGTGITTDAASNPTTATIISPAATTFTVETSSFVVAPVLAFAQTPPIGASITPGATTETNGVFTRTFTVSLPELPAGVVTTQIPFIVSNAADAAKKREFIVKHGMEKISFTTSKSVGSTVRLNIHTAKANEADCWIDLNNNGRREAGESITNFGGSINYTLGAQTVTVYGKIRYFVCANNQLTRLDVTKNIDLVTLGCSGNQLTALDVSKNTALTILGCSENQLTALDVSRNTALTLLDCANNQLTALNVSKNTALNYLYCRSNQFTGLDIIKNTALINLDCSSNILAALDVTKNTALTNLNCSSNRLTTLDVSKNTALTNLNCSSNRFTTLDVSKNIVLKILNCDSNQIKGANMTAFVNSLPTVVAGTKCVLVIYNAIAGDGNVALVSDVNIAKGKNWEVKTTTGGLYNGQ